MCTFFQSNWDDRSPVADEEVSCPCPGPRFCALSGAAALPDQEKLPFLSFSATAGRKVSVHYHQQNIICTLFFFFWEKPVSQAPHPLTLPFSHFETQLVCRFWPRLLVSQLENDQCWRWSVISWNLFRGVTYLWSVSAVSRSTINILMFLFPAVSCFWLWLHLWCSSDFVLTGPCTASGNIQIRSLPVSVVFLLTVLKLAK